MNSPVLDSEKDLEILLLSYRSVLVCLIPTHSPCVLCALESRAAAVLSAVSALAFSKHILVLWRFLVLSVVHDNFYKYFYSRKSENFSGDCAGRPESVFSLYPFTHHHALAKMSLS